MEAIGRRTEMKQIRADVVKQMVEAKKTRRQELAALPFDQKVEMVLKLQQMVYEMATAAGKTARKPWVTSPAN